MPKPSSNGDSPFPNFGVPYTHEELEHYRRLKQQIWSSRLGQLFRDYISQQDTTDQVLDLSSQITERVFSFAGEELIRMAAIQIMVEDLYARGAINPEIQRRLIVLNGNVSQRQAILNSTPIESLLSEVPYFVVVGFLAGSPELAIQARGALAAVKNSARRALSEQSPRAFFPVGNTKLNFRRLIGPSFFKGYKPLHAFHGFVNTFGPYSFGYIYLFRQRQFFPKEFRAGKIAVSGLEELVEIGEL